MNATKTALRTLKEHLDTAHNVIDVDAFTIESVRLLAALAVAIRDDITAEAVAR